MPKAKYAGHSTAAIPRFINYLTLPERPPVFTHCGQELVVKQHKMTEKQFHDTIMHLNAMPIEMIRAIMTNQVLDKDFKTNWRFYDDIDLSKSDW